MRIISFRSESGAMAWQMFEKERVSFWSSGFVNQSYVSARYFCG